MDEQDVLKDLKIDLANLIEEMSEQSALYARYAFVSAQTADDLARLKFEKEMVEADVNTAIREDIALRNQKVRESAIRAKINSDPRFQEANMRYLDAKKTQSTLETAVAAFEMRARMLSSIGALTRVEMEQNSMLGTPMRGLDQDRTNSRLKEKFNKLVEEKKGKKR